MLFPIGLEQFILFEFGIDVSGLIFLLDLFSLNGLILDNDMLILPSPPDLILNFLFLFGCLLDGGNDASLPSVYFDHLVLLHLLHYHLSPSLLSLVLLLFVFAIRYPPFLSCLDNRPFSLRLSLDSGLLRGLIFVR